GEESQEILSSERRVSFSRCGKDPGGGWGKLLY
ncbi:unnamed protein product, partial [marine sediment metagenome]